MLHKHYYIYIVTNKTNSTLYTGVTNNLVKRVYEHKQKLVPGFTARYNLAKLVYYETTDSIESAIQREKVIKGWVRKKKDVLIDVSNPKWKDLYQEIV